MSVALTQQSLLSG